MAPPKTPDGANGSIILRVYNYEPGTKSIKQKRTVELPGDKNLTEITLEYIRGILVQNEVFDSPDVTTPFCNTVGAEMDDSMTFSVYLAQLEDEKKQDDDKSDDGEDGEGNGAADDDEGKEDEEEDEEEEDEGVKDEEKKYDEDTSPSTIGKSLQVYYKKRKILGKMDNTAKEFLKKQLDLKLQKAPRLKNLRAKLLSSAFKADKWQASAGGKISIAANLNERDWSVITRVNCLLSGYTLTLKTKITQEKNDKGVNVIKELRIPTGVERTPYSAFKLKERVFEDYEVAAPTKKAIGGSGATTSDKALNFSFRIPRFHVDDASYVSVVETQNELQSSVANSSFSNTSVEASAGGGFWGISAAAKAGFALGKSENDLTAEAHKTHDVHISYNFPRVTVFLDENSLELTSEAKKDIAKVKDKKSLEWFSEKYGDVFSRRVRLGGKLTSTSHVQADTKTTQGQREKSLKISAAASFSGAYGSGSGGINSSSGEAKDEKENKQDFESNLSWEATGGDTTLCNHPPKWCGTVGDFYNWRVVELDDPIPLAKFISTFKKFEHVEQQFETAAGFEPLETGQHVYTNVRLIEQITHKPLIVSPKLNPLKEATKLLRLIDRRSVSFGIPVDKLLEKISLGGVIIGDVEQDQYEAQSTWTLARWAGPGENRKDHPYGAKTYLFNKAMPERRAKYIGVTDEINKARGSGFLYPTRESEKAWFIFKSPSGEEPRTGPLKNGDIVEIAIRDKGDSVTLGSLLQSEYVGDRPNKTVQECLGQVPAFGAQKSLKEGQKFLQFKVEILDSDKS